MAKRYPISRIKSHRSYEVEEVADLLNCTSQTVYQWIREGLTALAESRPYLILGRHLKQFLSDRDAARKHPLTSDEFWCVGCKKPRKSAFGLVENDVLKDGRPVQRGLCETCEGTLIRFVGAR